MKRESHYYDVLIGGSQGLIGNLINDLHKILHDKTFQGSIEIDQLGIKQIDYDIYAPPAIEFNQDHLGNVVMNLICPIQATSISKVSSRLNVKIKIRILASVDLGIHDGRLIVSIIDSRVSVISSSLGRGTQPLMNRLVSSIKPIMNNLLYNIFSAIFIPNISFSSKLSFNPVQISNINKYFLCYTTLSSGSKSHMSLPSSISTSTNLPASKLFIIFHNQTVNLTVNAYVEENPIGSGEKSIDTLAGTLSVSYIIHANDVDMKVIGRNKLCASANAIVNGSMKYGLATSPYSATAKLGIDASFSVDSSSGNLNAHFAVTSISNIDTRLFGVPNIALETVSNYLSDVIVKLLPQYNVTIFTVPTKVHIGLPIVVSNIEYNKFNECNDIIITGDVFFEPSDSLSSIAK